MDASETEGRVDISMQPEAGHGGGGKVPPPTAYAVSSARYGPANRLRDLAKAHNNMASNLFALADALPPKMDNLAEQGLFSIIDAAARKFTI